MDVCTGDVADGPGPLTHGPGYDLAPLGSGSSGSFEFRAHYKGETGVDADYGSVFTLTWSNAC